MRSIKKRTTQVWSVPGIGLTTKIWGLVVKLNEQQMQEAMSLSERGVDTWSISQIMGVHYDTMRKYIRQYERYGESIFTPYPTPVDESVDKS